ncbi:DNA methyltransferase [Mesorhizobium sp. KR9-304]|uniref:site-specific DNA-methyltransferase n=1 Tax=Mesorhizobium sp. KR9-304 TaxID=3156614 RepID=UPI0032B422EC
MTMPQSFDLAVEMMPISKPTTNKRNARKHSKKQIRTLARGIERYGFNNPIQVDEDGRILAGHARFAAAKMLGMPLVPCVRITGLSAEEKRAYVLFDNKLALNSEWDDEIVAHELMGLRNLDFKFDLSLTGFSVPEIDRAIDSIAVVETGDPADDVVPEVAPPRCRRGDVWQLGLHRLLCGSALDSSVLAALMNGEKAEMVFTDPPYNVPIEGHVGGSGRTKHREFAMACGEMSTAEFTDFLRTSFQNLVAYSVDGSIHFICMDWRHMEEMAAASNGVYAELKNLIVWAKDNGGMGSFYRSRHELIFAYKNGAVPHINTFELGQHGRYRTNVWQYRGVNTLKAGRMDELSLHPTVKPVQMIADAIKDVSSRGGIVLDLFGGSGSTLIAAHKTGRRGYIVELDPTYCDRIIQRYETFAHDEAELVTLDGDRDE